MMLHFNKQRKRYADLTFLCIRQASCLQEKKTKSECNSFATQLCKKNPTMIYTEKTSPSKHASSQDTVSFHAPFLLPRPAQAGAGVWLHTVYSTA